MADHVIVLPDRDALMAILQSVANTPELVKGYYSLFLEDAGEEISGRGVVMMFAQAIERYTNGKPPAMVTVMWANTYRYVKAIVTTNDVVLNDALTMLSQMGYSA
jgi:hypothetical protein